MSDDLKQAAEVIREHASCQGWSYSTEILALADRLETASASDATQCVALEKRIARLEQQLQIWVDCSIECVACRNNAKALLAEALAHDLFGRKEDNRWKLK